jgi:hypothetical protein
MFIDAAHVKSTSYNAGLRSLHSGRSRFHHRTGAQLCVFYFSTSRTIARAGVTTPVATIKTAPSNAAAGRFRWQNLELPAADEDVGNREDHARDKLLLPVIHSACIPNGMSFFNEHKFFAKLGRSE